MRKSTNKIKASGIKRQKYIQLAKIGAAALTAVSLCCWGIWRWYNPPAEEYNDFVVASAMDWLQNSDRGNFNDCRKSCINSKDWLECFIKDRKSLGEIQSRIFYYKNQKAKESTKIKLYELKFASKFSKTTHPKSQITERIIVKSDGEKEFKVLSCDFWLSKAFSLVNIALDENEKSKIMLVAKNVLNKLKKRDIGYFRKAYLEQTKKPDYFKRNIYFLNNKRLVKQFKIIKGINISQAKFQSFKAFSLAGRTRYELAVVQYNAGSKDHKKIIRISVCRDLYLNKSAPWEFYSFWVSSNQKKR